MTNLPDADPMPLPPACADESACCGEGCDPCILELFAVARERYQAELEAWHARHPERTTAGMPR